MNATFMKASRDMESFKKSLNFRLNLEKSRVQMLRRDHFTKFDAVNVDVPTEVEQLKEQLDSQDAEIKDLRALVETNPNLAERHARVQQLEHSLRKQTQPDTSSLMNKVLELIEQIMRSLEDHKTNLAFLECEVAQNQCLPVNEAANADLEANMDVD